MKCGSGAMTPPRLPKGWTIYEIVKLLPDDLGEDFLDELKMKDPQRYDDYLNYKRKRLEHEGNLSEDDSDGNCY